MLGLKKTLGAVEDGANSVSELADSARAELSDLSAQLRTSVGIGPAIIVGTAVVSIVALVLALVAVSRRD